jgi:hypothetical protein
MEMRGIGRYRIHPIRKWNWNAETTVMCQHGRGKVFQRLTAKGVDSGNGQGR